VGDPLRSTHLSWLTCSFPFILAVCSAGPRRSSILSGCLRLVVRVPSPSSVLYYAGDLFPRTIHPFLSAFEPDRSIPTNGIVVSSEARLVLKHAFILHPFPAVSFSLFKKVPRRFEILRLQASLYRTLTKKTWPRLVYSQPGVAGVSPMIDVTSFTPLALSLLAPLPHPLIALSRKLWLSLFLSPSLFFLALPAARPSRQGLSLIAVFFEVKFFTAFAPPESKGCRKGFFITLPWRRRL